MILDDVFHNLICTKPTFCAIPFSILKIIDEVKKGVI
jgi:hypothetical protein